MSSEGNGLSGKALSIFAFAAYHALSSGERVRSVIRKDGHGHEADPEGVAVLEAAALATASESEIVLSESGEAQLARILEAIRSAAR